MQTELSYGKFDKVNSFYMLKKNKIKIIFCGSKDYEKAKSVCSCVVVVDRRKKDTDSYRMAILLNSNVGDCIVSINQGDIVGKLCLHTGRTFLGLESTQSKFKNTWKVIEEERQFLRENPQKKPVSLFEFL